MSEKTEKEKNYLTKKKMVGILKLRKKKKLFSIMQKDIWTL